MLKRETDNEALWVRHYRDYIKEEKRRKRNSAILAFLLANFYLFGFGLILWAALFW